MDKKNLRRPDKKYKSYAIYASLIVVAVVFCVFIGVYIKDVWKCVTFVAEVLSPLVYGAVFALIMDPILNFFEKRLRVFKKRKLKRGICVALTYVVVLAVLSLLVYAIIPQIVKSFNDLTNNLAVYSTSFQNWVEGVTSQPGLFASIVTLLLDNIDIGVLSQPIEQLIQSSYHLLREFSPYIMRFLGTFFVQLKNILIGLIFAGYVLCSKETLKAQFKKLITAVFGNKKFGREGEDAVGIVKKVKAKVFTTFGNFIEGELLDALIVGVLTAIGLTIFRMPYIPLISVIVAVTNIIPFFGPFIGAIPCFVFIFITNPLKAIIFAGMILVIQQVDGNIIKPKAIGQTTGISPLGVLVSITVMGGLFGVPGMILGVPTYALFRSFIGYLTDRHTEKKNEKAEKTEKPEQSGGIVNDDVRSLLETVGFSGGESAGEDAAVTEEVGEK